ncbi:MAG: hypothetical protein FJ267_07775, partial [Planctomycetes bacterium]|nr:hypothetical protein [Planctomycetota bacterium]
MNSFQDFVVNWSRWLIHSTWQSAIVVALVAVLLLVNRRASSQVRYAILLMALVKFAIPPFMSLPIGLFAQSRILMDPTFDVEVTASTDLGENIESSDTRAKAGQSIGSASVTSDASASSG